MVAVCPPQAAAAAGSGLGFKTLAAAPATCLLPRLHTSSTAHRLLRKAAAAPLRHQDRHQLRPLSLTRKPLHSRLQASAQLWRPSGASSSIDSGDRAADGSGSQQQQPTLQGLLQRLRLPRVVLPWDEK